MNELAVALGARAAVLFIFDEQYDRIRVIRACGYPQAVIDRWAALSPQSPLLAAVLGGEPLFTRSRSQDSRFDSQLQQDFGDGAGFVVPLQVGGRTLAVLGGSFDHVRDFEPTERDFILTLARHCAQSLERARLFEAERAARAAADAARRELEAVLRQLPIAVSVVGVDGRVLINEQAAAFYNTKLRTANLESVPYPAAMMKHPDGTIYRDQDVPIVRALRGETVCDEEMLVSRADGSWRRVRVNIVPVRDEGGRIVSAVAVFPDITEEHRAAEQLRASDRRYRAVLRATNDVIWELDPHARTLEWNGALERVFGYRPEETNLDPQGGYGWWMAQIHPDDWAGVLEVYEHARDTGADTWVGEYRFRRADGTYVPTLDRCVFERDEHGKVVRVIGAMSDVSEQHRLLHELRDAVRVRDDFMSIAGHELRTPLAALSAQLLGLRQLPLDSQRRAEKLGAAERQVRRLSTLVDELLNVSRIVHGRLHLELETFDLAALVREAATRLGDDFQRGGTRLEVIAGAPVVGRWDRLRIDLIVTNLLTNALRYGARKDVRVSVEAAGEVARVVVEDHGIGVRPEDQERIFERFVRAVPSRQFGGLGVGLWLARQISAAHGGQLRVESEPGVGSVFTLELPQATG